jgi:hypothetical protein
VDAGSFDDDHTASAASPTFVIGDVAFRQAAIVGTEIGHMRAEHDAIPSRSAAEGQRLE